MAWHKGTWWPLAVKVSLPIYLSFFYKFQFFSFFEHLCDFVSGVVCAQGLPTHVRSVQVLHVLAHNLPPK